jgi:hypothetical protein
MITLTSWRQVNCRSCVSYFTCKPAECSKPYGCSQWVSEDGRFRAPELPTIERDDDGKITVTLPMRPGQFRLDPPLHVEAGDEVAIQRRMDPEPGGEHEEIK